MFNFSKILLPVDLEWPSMAAVHQGAVLARHFHSEVLLLHVIPHFSYLSIHSHHAQKDRQSDEIREAEAKLDSTILPELAGLSVRQAVIHGNPARLIPRIAREEGQGLIVMGTHGYGAVGSALVGSVTAGVLDASHVPVWTTAAHLKAGYHLEVRRILCAVDLMPGDHTLSHHAVELAKLFAARLILAHVTPSVENYGPGGSHVLPDFKEALVSSSRQQLAKLREDLGVDAELFIGSGAISKVLAQAAGETAADLLVIGRRATVNRLGGDNYAIIRDSPIPVLSV